MSGPEIPTRFGRVDAVKFDENNENLNGRFPLADPENPIQHLRDMFH